MRWREIILERSMSEVAEIIQRIRSLPTANTDIDLVHQRVTIDFVLDGVAGSIRLVPRRQETAERTTKLFRSKLFAAAIAVLGGRHPSSWNSAMNQLRGKVGAQSLRILCNPRFWQIDVLRYDGFSI